MMEPMAISPFRTPAPAPAVADDEESLRMALELQEQESSAWTTAAASSSSGGVLPFDTTGMDEETKASLELAWQLEQDERQRIAEQQAAAERLSTEPEDAESIALAIRLQQEDDELALRNALGVLPPGDDGDSEEPGSPSQYSYEQLMRLGETVGEVSRGAKEDEIQSLRTMTYAAAKADSTVILGEQCAICRMEFEAEDELRVLRCGHAEHCECIDQWLHVNKSCPICLKEINATPDKKAAPCAPCGPAVARTTPAAVDVGDIATPAGVSSLPATGADAMTTTPTAGTGRCGDAAGTAAVCTPSTAGSAGA